MAENEKGEYAVIAIGKIRAQTNGVRWTCREKSIEKILNNLATSEQAYEEFGYMPSTAAAMAELAKKRLRNTKILSLEYGNPKQLEQERTDVDGDIYY